MHRRRLLENPDVLILVRNFDQLIGSAINPLHGESRNVYGDEQQGVVEFDQLNLEQLTFNKSIIFCREATDRGGRLANISAVAIFGRRDVTGIFVWSMTNWITLFWTVFWCSIRNTIEDQMFRDLIISSFIAGCNNNSKHAHDEFWMEFGKIRMENDEVFWIWWKILASIVVASFWRVKDS